MAEENSTESRSVSLVLGSGGARGLAHIGADTSTVNLVIGLILIAVLLLDRQLNVKGKEELKI